MNVKYILLLFCIWIVPTLSNTIFTQESEVKVSGITIDQLTNETLPFVNVVMKLAKDSTFIQGTITNDAGLFIFEAIKPSEYLLIFSYSGYNKEMQTLFVGAKSPVLNVGKIRMVSKLQNLEEVLISGKKDEVDAKLDKKTYNLEENMSQSGGSLLQAMENLPGITVQDNKVQLRGSTKVTILINGKQSALTGIGGQSGLDNIPASAIERIEIISNPSSKYDANGNAGIINIILKKETEDGLNGKVGLTGGVGALWVRHENLPTIRPQYHFTPKINPSVSLNFRKGKVNGFLQLDNLYTHTLNKNEFTTRTYSDGSIINQQTKRNRNTNFLTTNLGMDWFIDDRNQLTVSGQFGSEKILDNGDQPFFNADNLVRLRLWQFLEDELKTTFEAHTNFQHKFKIPGQVINANLMYTFHRENEQYFFDNILPNYTGRDAFKLISDEQIVDARIDYVHPLKIGQFETGVKMRVRTIPTNMQFFPSVQSPLDTNAGGKAIYSEFIPALYGNYLVENRKWEAEMGIRLEYVSLTYKVNPMHNTYKSDGYTYVQPFPSLRLGYKMKGNDRLTLFFNRRVDRPNEVDIRIFPKYDDAEIIKVGNPSLKPQFTNSLELGYKHRITKGYWYSSVYSRFANGTITRISTTVDSSKLIYAIFQNTGKSNLSGVESVFSMDVIKSFTFNLSLTAYCNQIDAFTVQNLYPKPHDFTAAAQRIYSGNIKLNTFFHLKNTWDIQLAFIFIAPDIIPQGKIAERYTMNAGIKKGTKNGKGEFFINASDLFNTLIIKKQISGNGFSYTSTDYSESQVIKLGYSYKF
jgi:hypothetical protein